MNWSGMAEDAYWRGAAGMHMVRTVYEMKYGIATGDPQSVGVASGSQPRSGPTIESYMSPDQLSPVRHWSSTRYAEPKCSKLRCSLSSSPART